MTDFENFYSISTLLDDDSEIFPLMTSDDENSMNKENLPDSLSILPLRNTVLFPGTIIPITVGRDKSINLIKEAYKKKQPIGVVAQSNEKEEDPKPEDINKIGTIARIIKLLRMPDGNTTAIIQGKQRFSIIEFTQQEPFLKATVRKKEQSKINYSAKFKALIKAIRELATSIIEKSPNIPSEANFAIKNIESDTFLINFVISNMINSVEEKQKLLEFENVEERGNLLLQHLTKESQLIELKNNIQSKVKIDIDDQQKKYYLNQQIKQIQQELGMDPIQEEVKEFVSQAKNKKWPKYAKEKFEKTLSKFERLAPQSSEYSVEYNYLETILALPWQKYSKDKFDLKRAQKILDKDHYGLKKIKERIIEHLAVLKLKGDMRSPIICLQGPPGVGKTSLGKSIAKSLGKKYIRMSLGGLRDEAEIRGHRKTYIGAMPGRIIQSIKKAKYSNPVFILDEIDKLGNSYQGDPSSALLEVLDPEQNTTFYDNYIEMDYDLSKVMFIATANDLSNVHPALIDRMEVVNISGYTIEEKIFIAQNHLLSKIKERHGVKSRDVSLSNEVISYIVNSHTRESGVRKLEQCLSKVVRRVAKYIACEETYDKNIDKKSVLGILGPGHEREKYQGNKFAGVATGLAWTSVGGEILFIETIKYKGKGKLSITGNLGTIMKESVNIAMVYIKANAEKFGINSEIFDKWDVHVHIPEGSTPKDGPSAGITIFTALLSLFTGKKVTQGMAMTGEITLRGKVLPVGGIKEKILAAKSADIDKIIICKDNKKDIKEIDEKELKGLEFIYVKDMIEVSKYAVTKEVAIA